MDYSILSSEGEGEEQKNFDNKEIKNKKNYTVQNVSDDIQKKYLKLEEIHTEFSKNCTIIGKQKYEKIKELFPTEKINKILTLPNHPVLNKYELDHFFMNLIDLFNYHAQFFKKKQKFKAYYFYLSEGVRIADQLMGTNNISLMERISKINLGLGVFYYEAGYSEKAVKQSEKTLLTLLSQLRMLQNCRVEEVDKQKVSKRQQSKNVQQLKKYESNQLRIAKEIILTLQFQYQFYHDLKEYKKLSECVDLIEWVLKNLLPQQDEMQKPINQQIIDFKYNFQRLFDVENDLQKIAMRFLNLEVSKIENQLAKLKKEPHEQLFLEYNQQQFQKFRQNLWNGAQFYKVGNKEKFEVNEIVVKNEINLNLKGSNQQKQSQQSLQHQLSIENQLLQDKFDTIQQQRKINQDNIKNEQKQKIFDKQLTNSKTKLKQDDYFSYPKTDYIKQNNFLNVLNKIETHQSKVFNNQNDFQNINNVLQKQIQKDQSQYNNKNNVQFYQNQSSCLDNIQQQQQFIQSQAGTYQNQHSCHIDKKKKINNANNNQINQKNSINDEKMKISKFSDKKTQISISKQTYDKSNNQSFISGDLENQDLNDSIFSASYFAGEKQFIEQKKIIQNPILQLFKNQQKITQNCKKDKSNQFCKLIYQNNQNQKSQLLLLKNNIQNIHGYYNSNDNKYSLNNTNKTSKKQEKFINFDASKIDQPKQLQKNIINNNSVQSGKTLNTQQNQQISNSSNKNRINSEGRLKINSPKIYNRSNFTKSQHFQSQNSNENISKQTPTKLNQQNNNFSHKFIKNKSQSFHNQNLHDQSKQLGKKQKSSVHVKNDNLSSIFIAPKRILQQYKGQLYKKTEVMKIKKEYDENYEPKCLTTNKYLLYKNGPQLQNNSQKQIYRSSLENSLKLAHDLPQTAQQNKFLQIQSNLKKMEQQDISFLDTYMEKQINENITRKICINPKPFVDQQYDLFKKEDQFDKKEFKFGKKQLLQKKKEKLPAPELQTINYTQTPNNATLTKIQYDERDFIGFLMDLETDQENLQKEKQFRKNYLKEKYSLNQKRKKNLEKYLFQHKPPVALQEIIIRNRNNVIFKSAKNLRNISSYFFENQKIKEQEQRRKQVQKQNKNTRNQYPIQKTINQFSNMQSPNKLEKMYTNQQNYIKNQNQLQQMENTNSLNSSNSQSNSNSPKYKQKQRSPKMFHIIIQALEQERINKQKNDPQYVDPKELFLLEIKHSQLERVRKSMIKSINPEDPKRYGFYNQYDWKCLQKLNQKILQLEKRKNHLYQLQQNQIEQKIIKNNNIQEYMKTNNLKSYKVVKLVESEYEKILKVLYQKFESSTEKKIQQNYQKFINKIIDKYPELRESCQEDSEFQQLTHNQSMSIQTVNQNNKIYDFYQGNEICQLQELDEYNDSNEWNSFSD